MGEGNLISTFNAIFTISNLVPMETIANVKSGARNAKNDGSIIGIKDSFDKISVPNAISMTKIHDTSVFGKVGTLNEGECGRPGDPFVIDDINAFTASNSPSRTRHDKISTPKEAIP